MKRALKLDDKGNVIDHRPVPHADIDDTWLEVEWTKEDLQGMSFNELISKKAMTISKGKIVIDTMASKAQVVIPEPIDRISELEKRITALELKRP